MFTIDASVHINALNPREFGSAESQLCLQRLVALRQPFFSPTLLLVEVAAAIARVLDDTDLALELTRGIQALPRQLWIPLDSAMAELAAQLGAQARLRGADAVYAAVARHYGATLITRDQQQLDRLVDLVRVRTPEDVLGGLENEPL
ncbi:MAG: type II toxin-antitoxin system VapC family toxin [Anaerolineae bacterium]